MTTVYRAKFRYNGFSYFGWQIQNKSNIKTVQGEIKKSLEKSFKLTPLKFIGGSRTDAGVHALEQNSLIELEHFIPIDKIFKALNQSLPSDIELLSIESIEKDFHPVFDGKKKDYIYLLKKNHTTPWDYQYCAENKFQLNLDLMQKASQLFLGEHDFKNFQCKGTPVASTIRKILKSELYLGQAPEVFKEILPSYEKEIFYVFRFEGSGFLKQMVRLMVGALLNIGQKKISKNELLSILNVEVEKRAGLVVDPQGLYLVKQHY